MFVSERCRLWKGSRPWFEEECLRSRREVRERVGFDLPIRSDRRNVRIDPESECSVEEIVILREEEGSRVRWTGMSFAAHSSETVISWSYDWAALNSARAFDETVTDSSNRSDPNDATISAVLIDGTQTRCSYFVDLAQFLFQFSDAFRQIVQLLTELGQCSHVDG